jgi:D-beta-D-heptose 7-phosphate kinase/D-beta-D-heptose 1-phosphate adenosyltransferase
MSLLDKFTGKKILVLGDIMLDRYWWGNVSRISPEAPVPVVLHKRTSTSPGGAANVAANVKALGAEVTLIGLVGNEPEGKELIGAMKNAGIASDRLIIADRKTSVKTRIIAHNQQVVRIDSEETHPPEAEIEEKIIDLSLESLKAADLIIFSDYAKGVLTEKVASSIIKAALKSAKKVLVDPKGKDYSKYKGAFLVTPNRKEAAEACKLDGDGRSLTLMAGEKLLNEFDFQNILITEGEDGMTLFMRNQAPIHLASSAHQVFDVTGAGDTVIASLAVCLAAGFDLYESAKTANVAAGLAVEKIGATPITRSELEQSLLKLGISVKA